MYSDRGKIFVGGISWETSEERLKEHFNNFGHVADAVVVKERGTGRVRGFGFVTFSDPDVVERVVVEKHSIDGHMVEVKKAVPKDDQQNLHRSSNSVSLLGNSSRTTKIFVGGLASTVTEDDFKSYFSQYGNITDAVVMYDPNTQRPRGFGFITFDSEDAVERVLQQNTFHEIHDKLVEVKKAVPRELSAGRTGGAGGGFGGGRGGHHNSGYMQGSNLGPGNAYSGPHYTPSATGRGGFPSYRPAPYGTPGYRAAPAYYMPMNGVYGPAYPGGAGYRPAVAYGGGYGNTLPQTAFGAAGGYGGPVSPGAGYVGASPMGPRSPWGSSGMGYTKSGSPGAYGTGGAAGMSGYHASGWGTSGPASQTNGGNTGNGGYGYGMNDVGHNSSAGYSSRGMVTGPGGNGDPYSAAATSWNSRETHSSAGSLGAGASAGYMGPGLGTDGAGYGVTGKQMQCSPDTRFRPYPVTGEQST